jgi:TonB dependent receptor-like, beta-barrel
MSVIGLLPATLVGVSDVGGSTVGTQPIYLTYGQFSPQHFQSRVQLDGINTTDGGAAGLYFDYGAFDEVRFGTSSNDASMPNPGLQVNAVLKAGGNEFRGEAYVDFGDEALQTDNVNETQRRQGVGRGTRIRRYYDPNVNIGGPIKRDTLWFFTSVRNQHLATLVTGFPVEAPGTGPDALIQLQNLTYKLTYHPRPRDTLSHSIQLGRRDEPYRNAASTSYLDAVAAHDSLSWAGNLEWRAIVSPSFFMTTRVSTFGSDVRADAYGTDGRVEGNVDHRRFELGSGNSAGGFESFEVDRRRRQLEWTGTLFWDDWRGVNQGIRMGALTEWESTDTERTGHKDSVRLLFQSPAALPDFTVPFQVQLFNHPVTSSDRLWHHGAFVQDQIALSPRWTLNIGVRWDAYSAYYPEERLREGPFTDFFYRGQPLQNGYSIPPAPFGDTVPGRSGIIQYGKAFGPRVGLAWEIQGSGKAVVKASWGRYYSDPGTTISRDVNPLQNTSYIFIWTDGNGDRLFQPSELGSFVSSTGGVLNRIDPDIGHPYTDNMDVWMERRIRSNLSARLGFIYKESNNNWELAEQARVAALFSGSRQFQDPGPDGQPGTADDRGSYTAFDIPAALPLPASVKEWQTPTDFDETFTSIEAAMNKRMSNRWSLSSSFLFNWVHRLQNGHPDNPNEAINNVARVHGWTFKAFGTYEAPRGIRISPIVRHQAGRPSGRFLLTSLRAGVFSIAMEPAGSYREDNRTIFDARVEKQFRLRNARTFALFAEAFNILNSNAAQAQDVFTGRRTTIIDGETIEYQRFLRPLIILPPRIYRVGATLVF